MRISQLKGKGTGDLLLVDALFRALDQSHQIASWAVVMDAKNAKAVEFYKRYQFLEIPSIQNKLFLPMDTIAKLAKTYAVQDKSTEANSSQQTLPRDSTHILSD
jgi:hypothetical protein